MASQYGVNVITTVNAARPIAIQSSTPIGIVGTALLPTRESLSDANKAIYDEIMSGDPLYFGSAANALKFFDLLDGTIYEALKGIDDQAVNCPIIINVVALSQAQAEETPEDFYDDNAVKSAIITAINKLRNAGPVKGVTPDLMIAPRFSHDSDVSAALISEATRAAATAIIDLNAANESAALLAANGFGSKRAILCDPYVRVWDLRKDESALEPMSARVAGKIAWTDSQWESGWADSFSNREVLGISATARPIEFAAGQDCEADRLRAAAITTIIRYSGFRFWGGETTDIDAIWTDLARVRTFDRIAKAALDGLFWAIDRRADQLKSVKDSVEQLLLALKGSKVVLGFEVWWDEELNTKANITAGKFYLIAQFQDMPKVKRLEVNFQYGDKWGDVLIEMIG
jgi:phage tail sheath protein FI